MQHGAGGGNSTISGCWDQGVDLADSRRGSSAWEGWNLDSYNHMGLCNWFRGRLVVWPSLLLAPSEHSGM